MAIEVCRVKLYWLKMPLKRFFETSFGKTLWKHCIVVEINDVDGYTGWSEIVAGEGPWYSYETVETAWHIVSKYIIPLLLKRKLENIDEYIEMVKPIRGHNMAKAGIEMALWDIVAKRSRKSLSQIIGGKRDRIVSGVSIGIQRDIKTLLKIIEEYLIQGYSRIKVKIKPGWDIDVVKNIRESFPDIMLQVDANAAYTLNDTKVLKKMDRYNLLMIEQPLYYDDIIDHSKLRKKLDTPICLDESIKTPYHAEKAIEINSCDIINIKPGRVGGIINSLKIYNLCVRNGLGVWIGGMLETGIGRAYLVALASLSKISYPNDISASNRYFEKDIVDPEWRLNKDGTISVPDKPGIGVNIDIDELNKWTIKVNKFTK